MAYKKLEVLDQSPENNIYGLEGIKGGNTAVTIVTSSDISGDGYSVEFKFDGDSEEEEDNYNVFKRVVNDEVQRLDFRTEKVMIKTLTIQNVDFTDLYLDIDKVCKNLYDADSIYFADYQGMGCVHLAAGQAFQIVWNPDRELLIHTSEEADKKFIAFVQF